MEPGADEKPAILDTRGMPAPENILAVLRKVGELPAGSALELRMDANPMQLYDLLQQRGFILRLEQREPGLFAGRVTPRRN